MMPSDERLLAIALDGEWMAGESKERANKRYYADVAAACRAVIAAREVIMLAGMVRTALATIEPGEAALLSKLRAILGPTGGGDA